MSKQLKDWLKNQEKRYNWRKKTWPQNEYPDFKYWLINEIEFSIKNIPKYHKQLMKEFLIEYRKDILWVEQLKKYLKGLK